VLRRSAAGGGPPRAAPAAAVPTAPTPVTNFPSGVDEPQPGDAVAKPLPERRRPLNGSAAAGGCSLTPGCVSPAPPGLTGSTSPPCCGESSYRARRWQGEPPPGEQEPAGGLRDGAAEGGGQSHQRRAGPAETPLSFGEGAGGAPGGRRGTLGGWRGRRAAAQGRQEKGAEAAVETPVAQSRGKGEMS